MVYDRPCQLWLHIKSKQERLLENNGILPRLPPSAFQVPGRQNQPDANAPGVAVGSDVATQVIGRVYLPKLAHLGSYSSYPMPHVSTSGMLGVIRQRRSPADVYVLKDASSPTSYPQSQLHVHELLLEAGRKHGRAGELSSPAAMRGLSTLHTEGYRILSLFEILVFTYRWHLQMAQDGYKHMLLAPEGWRVLGIDSTAGSPPGSGVPRSDETPDISRTPAAVDQTESFDIHVDQAIDFLEALLVVAVVSRAGIAPHLPSLDNSNASPGCILGLGTLGGFRCTIDGLRAYAKVTGAIFCSPFTIIGLCRVGHSRKGIHLRSLNSMVFANFTYSLGVINEVQNEECNRKTLSNLLNRVAAHPQDKIVDCLNHLWVCGRCFCRKPLMRVFDQFRRVDVVELSSVLRAAKSLG